MAEEIRLGTLWRRRCWMELEIKKMEGFNLVLFKSVWLYQFQINQLIFQMSGKEISVVCVTIVKLLTVFGIRDHFKLQKYEIFGKLLNCCRNYLSGKVQMVVLNGSNTELISINAGVLQHVQISIMFNFCF